MRSNLLYICLSLVILASCGTTRQEESQTQTSKAVTVSQTETKVEIGLKVGQQAPDISLPDQDGNLKTLSSLRGKYILLDFWASWCGPCRYENPNVVRLFQKYKDSGFDVLSVSLDNNKKAWLNAVEADGMEWNHISDLKKWESDVIPVYQLDAIPMTYLLDTNGIIIAKNLRGQDLEKKLSQVLVK